MPEETKKKETHYEFVNRSVKEERERLYRTILGDCDLTTLEKIQLVEAHELLPLASYLIDTPDDIIWSKLNGEKCHCHDTWFRQQYDFNRHETIRLTTLIDMFEDQECPPLFPRSDKHDSFTMTLEEYTSLCFDWMVTEGKRGYIYDW